ncbi:hypothetical protein P280DRAFT_465454 [Massarina eburnea CBS 473.64]|uniref:Velvet domain-containing protein n=1 Tax=Massarina eburnea CBS 473.64 TaxID=1395130 RepID=A0A6A6SCW1_9PLEO|nr:hypothetical protein P280DRAFT_465454 [Massarina eburnea CBS 473.64]
MYPRQHPQQPQPHPQHLDSHGQPQSATANRFYKLEVGQQPVRARMCGFGDKDRRPITPPPCIKLIVMDPTGREIDATEVDSTFFVLTVDLWDMEAQREVNLVRHSSGAPTVSISSSSTTSFPPPPERPMYIVPMAQDPYGRALPYSAPHYPSGQYAAHAGAPPTYPYGAPSGYAAAPVPMMAVAPPTNSGAGMFTRNLIGSLSVNASKLKDTENKIGFWFVLQDLSVRTEGTFRLKMNFVDVGSSTHANTLNTGRASILATCFSEPFQVFSAKKFPGVIESTPLSKAFASQGIKIPIRKDGPKNINQSEYDADEQ